MLDIGQGDSFILHSNNKTVLIDTGGIVNYGNQGWKKKQEFSLAKSITIPYLKKMGIGKLDYLILTHGDSDHMKEAITLTEKFKVTNAYINDGNLNYLEKQFVQSFKNVKQLKRDNDLRVGDIHFYSLGTDLNEENDSSIVLYIKYKKMTILMMGDASLKSEQDILKNYEISNVDILKLGHHGSKTSSGDVFIKTVNPKLALISAGIDNKFNHPNEEVIERLKKYSIPYRLTSETGTVKIDLKDLTIKATRQ